MLLYGLVGCLSFVFVGIVWDATSEEESDSVTVVLFKKVTKKGKRRAKKILRNLS